MDQKNPLELKQETETKFPVPEVLKTALSSLDESQDFDIGQLLSTKPPKGEKKKNLKKKDMNKIVAKVKETIKGIEEAAKQIEPTIDLKVDDDYVEYHSKEFKEFLLSTNILQEGDQPCRGVTSNGIETDLYINSYKLFKYSTKSSPDSAQIVDIPTQLVLINRLNKLFGFQFIQQTDTSMKFGDVDRSICVFLKQSHKVKNHKITHEILNNLLKKFMITAFTTVESAFRSELVWVKPEFKKLIAPEVIMLQGLPGTLKESFNIFVNELTKIKGAKVFTDTSKLDILLHTMPSGVIEETLARTIKSMTPMFIYDYFEAVKSVYLFCGLLDVYLSGEVRNSEDLVLIARVTNMVYQNTRLYQNSTARSMPYAEEDLSELLQMYYLNHTISGPQYFILKMLEKTIPVLVAKNKTSSDNVLSASL